jgi:two-component system, chemotaxis family, chemotaxis protein CheY
MYREQEMKEEKRLKLLIVDDSKFTQKVEGNLFKEVVPNLEIYFANDGKEGVQKYIEINPDLTIVDLLMPNMTGMELLKEIKDIDKDAKMVVVSADVQEKVKQEAYDLGALAFVNKPINKAKIEEILNIVGM